MASTNPVANPIARYYEAQTAATAEIVQAALNGMQRLQQITLQAMRADTTAPAAEQTARFQRELLQTITEMNHDIVRASYSMMERMRDAFGTAAQVPAPMTSAFGLGNDPMALYDSAMRQWQTNVQQMMETPSVAMAVVGAIDDDEPRGANVGRPSSARKSTARRSTRRPAKKGKSAARKR